MYTCRWKNTCCGSMNNNTENTSEDYETMCNNVIDNCCSNTYNDCCDCGYEDNNCCGDIFPINPLFGQSYVPVQNMNQTFKPCIGLQNGSIFPELVDPYYPCQSIDFINYLKDTNEIGKGCNG